MIHINYYRWFL